MTSAEAVQVYSSCSTGADTSVSASHTDARAQPPRSNARGRAAYLQDEDANSRRVNKPSAACDCVVDGTLRFVANRVAVQGQVLVARLRSHNVSK